MSNLEELEVKNVCSLSCDAPTNMCSLLGDHTCGDGMFIVQTPRSEASCECETWHGRDGFNGGWEQGYLWGDKEEAIIGALKAFQMI